MGREEGVMRHFNEELGPCQRREVVDLMAGIHAKSYSPIFLPAQAEKLG